MSEYNWVSYNRQGQRDRLLNDQQTIDHVRNFKALGWTVVVDTEYVKAIRGAFSNLMIYYVRRVMVE